MPQQCRLKRRNVDAPGFKRVTFSQQAFRDFGVCHSAPKPSNDKLTRGGRW
jgi:hypothetical protein